MAESLLDWAETSEALFVPTGVGIGVEARANDLYRRSVSVSQFGPVKQVLREQVMARAAELIGLLKMSSVEIASAELEFVAHGDGAFYGRHVDTFVPADAGKDGARVLSAVYYAYRRPKAFSGGAFRLHAFESTEREGAWLDIEPEHNMLLVFPAWAPHEVRPVTCPSGRFADARFAANIWLYKALSSPIRPD